MKESKLNTILSLQYIVNDKRDKAKKAKQDSNEKSKLKLQIQDLEDTISSYL